eukprot:TRINITY_DN11008_c0_g1_i1.p1 TRINITY_DN11008_c0_g1~~TRINITY_DN11008_c0_g1_i1.p1  ORF type:complete len:154 (-),score=19.96 TRINITY_DN11008_c0_g1_i1:52-465(-)
MSAFKIKCIDHLVLRTANLENMLEFYTNTLNCVIERQTSPELGLTQLRAGNQLIDIVDCDSQLGRMGGGPPTNKDNNLDHFCLRLEKIEEDEVRQHLESKGVTVGEFVTRYGAEGNGLSVYIQDPDGNTIELRSEIE